MKTRQKMMCITIFLKIDDTGMMGYIDIPKLDVVLPVYHGTSEKVLQSGVGHLKNTSLPVGGELSCGIIRTPWTCKCQDIHRPEQDGGWRCILY